MKFEGDRMREGLFMGYDFKSGRKWSKDYYVLDIITYTNTMDGRNCHCPRVRDIRPVFPIHWPVKDGTLDYPGDDHILKVVEDESKIPLGDADDAAEQSAAEPDMEEVPESGPPADITIPDELGNPG